MSSLIKKTVIITGYNCNNKCKFCIDDDKRHLREKTTEEIIAEMIEAKIRKRSYLEIIGGEQTIRPDILYLVKTAKKLKFKTIAMATNGRMLAYTDFAEKLIQAGLTSIIFSIHGHNGKLHDSITRVNGSFQQLINGIMNVKKMKFKNIGSNTTIIKENYIFLPKIGKFLFTLGIKNSEFIFVDSNYGAAKNHFDKLVPKISIAAPYIRKCLDIGKKNNVPHWHIRYVPLCYFRDYKEQISELYEVKKFQSEHLAPDFKNFEVEDSRKEIGRIKTKKCERCCDKNACEGIWKEYFKHYGDKELKPKGY